MSQVPYILRVPTLAATTTVLATGLVGPEEAGRCAFPARATCCARHSPGDRPSLVEFHTIAVVATPLSLTAAVAALWVVC